MDSRTSVFYVFLKVANGVISKEKAQTHVPLRMEVTLFMI